MNDKKTAGEKNADDQEERKPKSGKNYQRNVGRRAKSAQENF